MNEFPVPVQAFLLGLATLGVLSFCVTAFMMWSLRSGEKARRSPKLIRYERPDAETAYQALKPPPLFSDYSGPLKLVTHDDLFRETVPVPEYISYEDHPPTVRFVGQSLPMTREKFEENQDQLTLVNTFLEKNFPLDR